MMGNDLIVADVAVIGAGPAGIAAAIRAAECGQRVVVLDESPAAGGQIWRHRPGHAIPIARRWIARLSRSGATVLTGTSVIDLRRSLSDHFAIVAERDGVPLLVDAGAVILATGARERFVPFPGWTLPGIVGVGGAQALLKSGVSYAGKRVVIAGSGPLLLPVASSLSAAGAKLLLVAEQASAGAVARFAAGLWKRPAALVQAARFRGGFIGTSYATGTWVTAARGGGRVEEVVITDGSSSRTIACDVLCTAHGLVPNTELARLLGCEVAQGAVRVDDNQRTSVPGIFCVGESTGIGGVDLSLVEGEIAGACVGGQRDSVRGLSGKRARLRDMARAMEHAFAPRAELRAVATPDTIVCRCEDVPLGALSRGWTARQAKLYTRAGMGPCQGRVCGASLEFLFGWTPDTARLPSEPALLSTLLADSAHVAGGSPHPGA